MALKLTTKDYLSIEEGKIYRYPNVTYDDTCRQRAMAHYISRKYGKGEWKINHKQIAVGKDKYDIELERVKL